MLGFFLKKETILNCDRSWAWADTALSCRASHSGFCNRRLRKHWFYPPLRDLNWPGGPEQRTPVFTADGINRERLGKTPADPMVQPTAVLPWLTTCFSFFFFFMKPLSFMFTQGMGYRKKCSLFSSSAFLFRQRRKPHLDPHEGKSNIYKGSSHTSSSNKSLLAGFAITALL